MSTELLEELNVHITDHRARVHLKGGGVFLIYSFFPCKFIQILLVYCSKYFAYEKNSNSKNNGFNCIHNLHIYRNQKWQTNSMHHPNIHIKGVSACYSHLNVTLNTIKYICKIIRKSFYWKFRIVTGDQCWLHWSGGWRFLWLCWTQISSYDMWLRPMYSSAYEYHCRWARMAANAFPTSWMLNALHPKMILQKQGVRVSWMAYGISRTIETKIFIWHRIYMA